MPARHFSSVLLPEPLRPTIPKNSPASTVNETSCSASNSDERSLRNGCSARSLSVCIRSVGIWKALPTSLTTTAGGLGGAFSINRNGSRALCYNERVRGVSRLMRLVAHAPAVRRLDARLGALELQQRRQTEDSQAQLGRV